MTTIKVRDFGPIREAEVEMRPLTVLIGPNNTGKSYLALLLYSLQRSLMYQDPRQRSRRNRRRARTRHETRLAIRRIESALDEAGNLVPLVDKLRSGEAKLSDLPEVITEWLLEELPRVLETSARNFEYELRVCFGQSINGLCRRIHPAEHYKFSIELTDERTGLVWGLRCQDDELITEKVTLPQLSPDMPVGSHLSSPRRFPYDPEYLTNYLLDEFLSIILPDVSHYPHYLPATRSGILQAHKTLASLIVDRAFTAWVEPMEIERMPGVVADLIQALLSLRSYHRPAPDVQQVIDFLESDVTLGSVDIRSTGVEYPEIYYTNPTGQFEFYQVSSMVSETAPLILFLKSLVKAEDLFIIEEPEAHLDPYNQTRLARAIAMMVNAGIRVLVTTHSDILLNQLLNLVQASQLPEGSNIGTKYADLELLDSENIAAYLFRNEEEGTRLQRLDIRPESSSLTELADYIHRSLYDESVAMEHGGML